MQELYSAMTPVIQQFPCTQPGTVKTVEWGNNKGCSVYVVDGYVWIGVGMGGRADIAFTVGTSTGFIVIQTNWDHYAEPHGIPHNIAPFGLKGYSTIPANGSLWLTIAGTGPYSSDPAFGRGVRALSLHIGGAMKIATIKIAVVGLLLLFAAPAFAQPIPNAKNQGVTISNTQSTQVLPANDLGLGLRDYLLIQCTGGNTCYCCVGNNNTCSTLIGTALTAGTGTWILTAVTRSNGIVIPAPVGDVSCIAGAGSSQVVTFDY